MARTLIDYIKQHDPMYKQKLHGGGHHVQRNGGHPGPEFEPTPEWDTVTQYEQVEVPLLRVEVDGVVPVIPLPPKRSVLTASSQNLGVAQTIVDYDPRILSVTLIAPFSGFYIGTDAMLSNPGASTNPQAIPLPSMTPLVIHGLNGDAVMAYQTAASITANGAGSIGIITEFWAD